VISNFFAIIMLNQTMRSSTGYPAVIVLDLSACKIELIAARKVFCGCNDAMTGHKKQEPNT